MNPTRTMRRQRGGVGSIPVRVLDTDQAACTDSDPELWFAQSQADRQFALDTCNHYCPIRDACRTSILRAEALGDNKYLYGIVGGLTAQERRELIVPLCQRCETSPRRQQHRYCAECAPLVRAEVLRRADRNRYVA